MGEQLQDGDVVVEQCGVLAVGAAEVRDRAAVRPERREDPAEELGAGAEHAVVQVGEVAEVRSRVRGGVQVGEVVLAGCVR